MKATTATNAPPLPPRHRLTAFLFKRVPLWSVLLVGLVLLAPWLWFGLSGVPHPSDTESAILSNLEIYGARGELDDKNQVVRLRLEGKGVTDEALDEAVKLPHLRGISLHDSSITDAGLLKLTRLKRLQELGITDTPITDRGLSYLTKVAALQDIWLCRSARLTTAGIAALQRALPALRVHVMNGP